jgi:hypothetical protein
MTEFDKTPAKAHDVARIAHHFALTAIPKLDGCSMYDKTQFEKVRNELCLVLSELRRHFNITRTELILLLMFIGKIGTSSKLEDSFRISVENISLTMITSFVLIRKVFSDECCPLIFSKLANLFKSNMNALLDSESYLVDKFGWVISCPKEEFMKAENILLNLLPELDDEN